MRPPLPRRCPSTQHLHVHPPHLLARHVSSKLFPRPPPQPYSRPASTSSANTDWLSWIKKASALRMGAGEGPSAKALIFAGLGSYPHTPYSPTSSSLLVWEEASEALLTPDATIGYWPTGMEEFDGALRGAIGIRGWMRGWVEGRSLDELMARADVTAAFILTSSIAILASAQEHCASNSLLPEGTTHLAGYGFIGTLTALVATGRLDLATGVRLAMMYASLPSSPSTATGRPPKYVTTVLSARHFHSLSSPPWDIPDPHIYYNPSAELSDSPAQRRRAMQLILDEVHAMQKEWLMSEDGEWAAAGFVNSSKVFGVTGTQDAVWHVIERLQQLALANPVMDVPLPCPYNTELMDHALPTFENVLSRCPFRNPPSAVSEDHSDVEPVILDPLTTHRIGPAAAALAPHLTHQLRWHKTLSRLYRPANPTIDSFYTIGRGARGLGIMLRGELKRRPEGAKGIQVAEFGVKDDGLLIQKKRALG